MIYRYTPQVLTDGVFDTEKFMKLLREVLNPEMSDEEADEAVNRHIPPVSHPSDCPGCLCKNGKFVITLYGVTGDKK
jgi:hypothetical protein